MGHVVNRHCTKQDFSLLVTPAITFYSAHKALQSTMMGQRFIFFKTALVCIAKNATDLLINRAYSRNCEREADHHVIQHTQDSAPLKAMADWFNTLAKKEDNLTHPLLYTHPTDAERAKTFQKAARALKEKST